METQTAATIPQGDKGPRQGRANTAIVISMISLGWNIFASAPLQNMIKSLRVHPTIEISQLPSESRSGAIYNHFVIKNTGQLDATNVVIRATKLVQNSDLGLTELSEFKIYSDTLYGVETMSLTRDKFPAGAKWNLDISIDTIQYNKIIKQNKKLGCKYSSVPNVLSISYTEGEKVRCKD